VKLQLRAESCQPYQAVDNNQMFIEDPMNIKIAKNLAARGSPLDV
jgi:hypothetical protein